MLLLLLGIDVSINPGPVKPGVLIIRHIRNTGPLVANIFIIWHDFNFLALQKPIFVHLILIVFHGLLPLLILCFFKCLIIQVLMLVSVSSSDAHIDHIK